MKAVLAATLGLALLAAPVRAEDESERERFTEEDLPSLETDPAGTSEIDEFARARGFRYARDTRRAARGDFKALKKFFEIAQGADGAAAESIAGVPTVVYHLLGDEKFAKFLGAQPVPYQMMVRNLILGNGLVPAENLKFSRESPESARLLFPREIVGWFSPNDVYAIRKVFSDPFELRGSKVARAELIEKKTGQVLCDLTPDDIGTGADREGDALWSPDSKRVACLSSDLTEQPWNSFTNPQPPLRKQTAVYQVAGDVFARVEVSLNEAPSGQSDTEVKGAVVGHKFTEPVRWQKRNVLILQRHEYYRKLMPTELDGTKFDSIHDLARLYQITATINPDGKGTAIWKRLAD